MTKCLYEAPGNFVGIGHGIVEGFVFGEIEYLQLNQYMLYSFLN